MENRGYSIYEIGILGGNDKGEIKFILFLMFFEFYIIYHKVYTLSLFFYLIYFSFMLI